MQVSAISANNNNVKSFGNSSIENLKKIANLNDDQLKELSIKETYNKKELKKTNSILNTLIALVPIGTVTAALFMNRGINASRMTKLGIAVKDGLKTATALTVGIGTFSAIHKAEKSNKKVNDFTNNHPFLSFLATITGACTAFVLTKKGASALYKTVAPLVKSHLPEKIATPAKRIADKINNSAKITGKMEQIKKLPKPVKSLIKFVGNNADSLAIISAVLYPFMKDISLENKAIHTYNDLREKRDLIRAGIEANQNDNTESV